MSAGIRESARDTAPKAQAVGEAHVFATAVRPVLSGTHHGGSLMHPFAYQPLELVQAVILAVRCVLHVYSSGTPCVPT
ncbi:hypothetical protein ABZV91_09920 [Nocardia sp. NPDC004568]|uniref:hypothetical protein n=1 Tax=Nocardia sp. NPDC004568 TaxID=3154551 RepID=UPI0033AA796C